MIAIAMMVAGIVMLIKGTVSVSSTKELRRPGSVFVGLVLIIPFPLSFAIGFMMGLNAAQKGQNLQDIQKDAVILDLAIVGIGVVLALILSFAMAEPKRKKKKKKRRLDEYDDLDARAEIDDEDRFDEFEQPSRRRSRDEDDEEEKRPRQRRRYEDQDDDDRPRRR